MNFSLDELKHGVLRGNKKTPGAMFRFFGTSDKRNILPGNEEPRIHFLALDYPEIPEQIEIFKEGCDFSNMLDNLCREYINKTVCFDDYNGELVLPIILQTYLTDFANSESDLVKWVWKYFTGNANCSAEDVIAGINKRSIMIKYVVSQQ